MTREDVERLMHCARHEAQGAGPNTLAEVCEWALGADRGVGSALEHCEIFRARAEDAEKRLKWMCAAQDGFGGTDYPDDFCEACRIEGYSMCRCAERSPSPGPEFATCACEAGGRRLTEFSAPELHRPGCSRDFDPAPSVCSVCGVGAGKHKPDCSRPPAPSAEPPKYEHCDGCDSLTCGGWLPTAEVEARIAQARDEALEEAALAANRLDDLLPMSSSIPDAIRALKSKKEGACFDLVAHLHRQRAFSERTFGPGERTAGVLDHIRKELLELEQAPGDLTEWIDVVLLAFDGAWRAGHAPEAIAQALEAKQAKNEARTWPDWRTAEPGKAIEHVRREGGHG